MKYLLTIVILVLASTVLTLVFLWPDSGTPLDDIVLSVNGHAFSQDFFDNLDTKHGYHNEDGEDQINSVITRELMIQEAQRLNIDKEELFRAALKNYYEQSLIKILTDRQYLKFKVNVSEEEVDTYLSCFGKTYTFTSLPAAGKDNAPGQQHTVLFDDLAESLRLLLTGMQPGESKEQFNTGSQVGQIRLDGVKLSSGYQVDEVDRQHIRTLLAEQKRSEHISTWMNDLRNKASITVYEKADSHGE